MAFLQLTLALTALLLCSGDLGRRPSPATLRLQARRDLGRLLFFDPALSENYKRSCASCHRPEKAFTDQRIQARAFAFSNNLPLNTPTVLNTGGQTAFFHDGRAGSLAAVIASVIASPREFNSSYALIIHRLSGSPDYQARFRQAYGSGVTRTSLNDALTVYIRSLTRRSARFDQFMRHEATLPQAAGRGYALFSQQLLCAACHRPPWFSDGRRHRVAPDRLVRTPGLRNVVLTPPYLTDGSAPTIDAVLQTPLHRQYAGRLLTDTERADLYQFLTTLTDTVGTTQPPTTLPTLHQAPPRRIGGQY